MLNKIKVIQRETSKHSASALMSTIWSVYFSDEVSFYGDHVVRFLSSTCNIAVIILVWSATHSILQCVVWMLIMPVVQEAESHSIESKDIGVYSLLAVLWKVLFRITPFATVCVCAASLGNKIMGCFGSAMVDANASLNSMDYPLMRSQIIFMTEVKSRFLIWMGSLIVMVAFLLVSFRSTAIEWMFKEPKMIYFVWVAFLTEVAFVCVTVSRTLSPATAAKLLSHPLQISSSEVYELVDHILNSWWVLNITYMRAIALCFVALGILLFSYWHGVVNSITLGLLILMLFGLPHIFVTASLHAAGAAIRTLRSLNWLRRHSDAVELVVFICFPYQLSILLAVFSFLHHTPIVVLLLWNNALLISKAIDLVREFDVSQYGSVHWKKKKTKELIPPMIAIVLEDAYEKKRKYPEIVSLDMSFNIDKMQISEAGLKYKVSRIQVIPYGASRRYRFNIQFYLYTLPRLLSLQNRGDFSGTKYRAARVILRVLVAATFVSLVVLVAGIIFQTTLPFLRPPPARVSVSSEGDYLTFDHIVVRLLFFAKGQKSAPPSSSNLTRIKWNGVRSAGGEDFYPLLCTREFFDTSVFELAVLALVPYLFSSSHMTQMVEFINSHFKSDWVLRELHGTDCDSDDHPYREPSAWNGFVDLYSIKRNLTVVAIRGTDLFSFKDFLIDVNLFFETVIYQFAASNIPGAVFTPQNLIEDLIRIASIPPDELPTFETWDALSLKKHASLPKCHLNNYRRDFYMDVNNHLAFIATRGNSSRVLLTGHSLGGALAAIVGSQMHIQAVSFGSPGILASRKKFHLTAESIHKYVTTIVSSNDVFPLVGRQGGEIHHVLCLSSMKEACHALEFLIGTLWRSCSSIRERFPLLHDVA